MNKRTKEQKCRNKEFTYVNAHNTKNETKTNVFRLKTIRIGNFIASVFQFLAFGMSQKMQRRRSGRKNVLVRIRI